MMNSSDKQKVSSPQAAEASRSDERDASTLRRVTSEELLAGKRELVIEHSGEKYRLRLTSKGKLILTK